MTPPMGGSVGPDDERDAYLREALRHAPDAALAPPASVSDAILRKARSAPIGIVATTPGRVTGAHARRALRSGADLWSWLARPSVAAGFASVIVATLVGMLWWDRPIDDAVPRRPESATKVGPARSGAPAYSDAPDQTDAPREPAVSAEAAAPPEAPAKHSVAVAPKPETAALKKAVGSSEKAALDAPQRAVPQRAELSTARPTTETDSGVARDRAADRLAASPARVPSPPTSQRSLEPEQPDQPDWNTNAVTPAPPQPFPVAPDGTSADPMRRPPQALDGSAASGRVSPGASMTGRPERAAPTGSLSRAPALQSRAGATDARGEPAAAPLGRRLEAQRASSPLAALRASLAAEPQRWAWAREDKGAQPMDAAVQRWLTRLDESVAARAPQPDASAAAPNLARRSVEAGGAHAAQTLRLLRDGKVYATMRIGAGQVQIESIDNPAGAWQAPLAQEAAAALNASMPQAPR